MTRPPSIFVFPALVLPLVSCGTAQVEVAPKPLTPVVAQAPLDVAVTFDAAPLAFRCNGSAGWEGPKWSVALGEASRRMFAPALAAMFEDVAYPATPDAAPGDRPLIRISLDAYDGCEPDAPSRDTMRIVYTATVFQSGEQVLADWTAEGSAGPQDAKALFAEPLASKMGRMTALAIRRAVGDFVRKFEDDDNVRAWKESAIAARAPARTPG